MPETPAAAATIADHTVMVLYDLDRKLTSTTGMVSSEISRTMPIIRIDRTIVIAVTTDIV